LGTQIIFETIKPKTPNVKLAMDIVIAAIEKETALHRRTLGKTTTGWTSQPRMETDSRYEGDDYVATTAPSGDKKAVDRWKWTDQGTKAHTIRARRAPMLRFKRGYKPRTRPGSFSSGQSKRFGPTVVTPAVRHPGTKARNWSGDLTKKRKQPFAQSMQKAMQRAANSLF
jgi:hypothetical protein